MSEEVKRVENIRIKLKAGDTTNEISMRGIANRVANIIGGISEAIKQNHGYPYVLDNNNNVWLDVSGDDIVVVWRYRKCAHIAYTYKRVICDVLRVNKINYPKSKV